MPSASQCPNFQIQILKFPMAPVKISLQCWDIRIMNASVKTILHTIRNVGIVTSGKLPVSYRGANGKTKCHPYQRFIDIPNPTPKMINDLSTLTLPNAVQVTGLDERRVCSKPAMAEHKPFQTRRNDDSMRFNVRVRFNILHTSKY